MLARSALSEAHFQAAGRGTGQGPAGHLRGGTASLLSLDLPLSTPLLALSKLSGLTSTVLLQYLDLRLTFGPYSPTGGDASSTCSSNDSVFSHDPLPLGPSSFPFPEVQT